MTGNCCFNIWGAGSLKCLEMQPIKAGKQPAHTAATFVAAPSSAGAQPAVPPTIHEEWSTGRGWAGVEVSAVQAEEARLQQRLWKLKLEHYVMEGDGNCQFRAVSFGLYGAVR